MRFTLPCETTKNMGKIYEIEVIKTLDIGQQRTVITERERTTQPWDCYSFLPGRVQLRHSSTIYPKMKHTEKNIFKKLI